MTDNHEAHILSLIDRAYDALEFKPGDTPDWNRFASVFTDNCILALRVFPDDDDVRVLSLEGYMKAQLEQELQRKGYSETPGKRELSICGDIAWVEQDFTMNFSEQHKVPAKDVFSLVRTGREWKVVSVISDMTNNK